MTETVEAPAGAGFAAMMAGAADLERPEAPFGYTRDRETGDMRPKKSPGRGGKNPVTPPVEVLKAASAAPPADVEGGDPVSPAGSPTAPADRAPDLKRGGKAAKPDTLLPPYKAGVICSGVNKLYRKTGKLVRGLDKDIGDAFIDSARNTADVPGEDDSVGAAWEQLARTNPRIRRAMMKLLMGGAWTDLAMAHAPIALAVVMKPAIRQRLPLMRIAESLAEPDEDSAPGEGGLPGGMTMADLASVRELALAEAEKRGIQVPEYVMEGMAAMANGGAPLRMPDVSRETVRTQPRRPGSRSDRRGG